MCGYSSHCVSRASSMPSLQTRLPRWPLAAQQPQWQPGGCGRPSLRNVMAKGFQLVGALIAGLVLDTACYMRCGSSGVALRRHLALGVKGVSCFGIQIILLEAWARGVSSRGEPRKPTNRALGSARELQPNARFLGCFRRLCRPLF